MNLVPDPVRQGTGSGGVSLAGIKSVLEFCAGVSDVKSLFVNWVVGMEPDCQRVPGWIHFLWRLRGTTKKKTGDQAFQIKDNTEHSMRMHSAEKGNAWRICPFRQQEHNESKRSSDTVKGVQHKGRTKTTGPSFWVYSWPRKLSQWRRH